MAGGKGGGGISHEEKDLARQMQEQGAQLFGTASPYFGSSLAQLYGNAGYGGGQFQPLASQPWFRSAQEQTGQSLTDLVNRMRYQQNQEGLARSPVAAAQMANLMRGAAQDYGNFYRVQAPQIQNQRIMQALGAAAPGIGNTEAFQGGALQGMNQAAQNALAQRGQNYQLIGSSMGALAQFAPYMGL